MMSLPVWSHVPSGGGGMVLVGMAPEGDGPGAGVHYSAASSGSN